MAEIGYKVTAKMPTARHAVTGEPAVEYEPAVMADGMPDVGMAYDLVKSMMQRSTLPAGTEVRIIYVWPTARESAVSVNWIKSTKKDN